jgi:hypothetical protein
MTEYELIDSLNSSMSLWLSSFMAYVSFLSAYLAVAYLVGKDLTRQQSIIISTLFCFSSGLTLFAIWGLGTRIGYTVRALNVANPDYPVAIGPGYREALFICCALGVIASLKFMWEVRKTETE